MKIESHTKRAVISATTVPLNNISLILFTPDFVRRLYKFTVSWTNFTKGSFNLCLRNCRGPNERADFNVDNTPNMF